MAASLAGPPVPPDGGLQPRRRFLRDPSYRWENRLPEVESRPGSHSQEVVEPRAVWLNHGLASQTDWSQAEAGEILHQPLPPPWPSLSAPHLSVPTCRMGARGWCE